MVGVGSELDIGFDNSAFAWQEQMTRQGLAKRTIQDRLEFLLQWRELVVKIASNSELPNDFKGALNEAIERRGVTNLYLSKETGIATMTLKFWREGTHQPTRNTEQNIKKLEAALRLPASTLAQRLGYTIKRHQVTRAAKEQRNQPTQYGERLRRQRKREYRLNYLIAPPESIRAEWQLLLVHKTNPFRERASPREIWRCKPIEMIGHKPDWSELYAGQAVPAANAAWTYISRYLSWLALEPKHGGKGLPIDRIGTLAWLLNDALMLQFLAWMQRRSDNKIHRGIAQVLHCAASLLRPGTGWLWLNPQLALAFAEQDRPFGFNPKNMAPEALATAWQSRCRTVWEQYEKQSKTITTSKACVKSRDPQEPIADILALPQPLSAVTAMLATLKQNPPWCVGTKRHAVWLRDVLLLSWLIAKQIRAASRTGAATCQIAVRTKNTLRPGRLVSRVSAAALANQPSPMKTARDANRRTKTNPLRFGCSVFAQKVPQPLARVTSTALLSKAALHAPRPTFFGETPPCFPSHVLFQNALQTIRKCIAYSDTKKET